MIHTMLMKSVSTRQTIKKSLMPVSLLSFPSENAIKLKKTYKMWWK